jgi:hypothetical protein
MSSPVANVPDTFRGNWVIVRRPTSEFSILIAELESLPRPPLPF